MNENETYLTPKQLAKRWSMAVQTLANWRKVSIGKGPKFKHIGGVRYALSEVIKYEDSM